MSSSSPVAKQPTATSSSNSGWEFTVAKDFASNLVQLRDLHSGFHKKCTKCGSEQELPPSTEYPSAIFCNDCKMTICVGCGKSSELCKSAMVQNSCEEAVLVQLWQVLCDFDQKILDSRGPDPNRIEKQETAAKETKIYGVQSYDGGNNESGDGELELKDSGVGYGDGHYDKVLGPSIDLETDAVFAETLDMLNRLLSSMTPDLSRLVLIPVLFQYSFVMDEVASLLRNDSITNIAERNTLYGKLFTFLQKLLLVPSCHTLFLEQRPKIIGSLGLRALSVESTPEVKISTDLSPSLISCFTNTYRQSKSFLELDTKQHPTSSNGQDLKGRNIENDQGGTEPCQRIVEIYESFRRLQDASDNGHVEDLKIPWEAFCEENKVTFTDGVLKNHHFEKVFRKIKNSSMGRMSIIGRDIASMATSLPAGIFVKIAESRSDVMKVLIVGVQGSPYAGGLFPYVLRQGYRESP